MIQPSNSWIGLELSGGRYRVAEVLGQGGMGQVYRAHDKILGKDVVIKVPRPEGGANPELAGRIIREVRALAKLAHPHIVPVLDAGEFGGLPFAVIRFLPGGSLKDRRPIAGDGRPIPMPAATLGAWLPEVARALDFIHARNYVHRDVKPDNILFDEVGNAYLGDFGLAKALAHLQAAEESQSLTQSGMVAGTPLYMAPEAFLGRPLDGRADQYSLAVMVFEMLTGLRPFGGSNAMEILAQRLTNEPPDIRASDPTIAEPVARALRRGMAREPEQRFPSCHALARALIEPGVVDSRSSGHPVAVATARARASGATGSMALASRAFRTPPTTARSRRADRRWPPWSGMAALVAANILILAIVRVPRGRDDRPVAVTRAPATPHPRPEIKAREDAIAAPAMPGSMAEWQTEDPEDLLRSADQALRKGRLAEADDLLNSYLTRPGSAARDRAIALLLRVRRASSAAEARARLRTLDDADLEAIADGSTRLTAEFPEPSLQARYLETLRANLGAERRRRAADDPAIIEAESPAPRPLVRDPIERVQAAPGDYQGRVVEPPGFVRIATRTIEADGGLRLIALKEADGRTLATGLEPEPAPALLFSVEPATAANLAGWLARHRVSPTAVPEYRAVLRFEVQKIELGGIKRWAAVITGVEYLVGINYVKVMKGDLQESVTTFRVGPDGADLAINDGGPWIDRLGGADHIKLVRRKYQEAFRRFRGERRVAELDAALQGMMGQALKIKQQYDAEVARQTAAMIRGIR